MRSRPDPNVFTPDFLDHLDKTDYNGETEAEAEFAGPWRVVEQGRDRFAVLHETASNDSRPAAVFKSRETATLVTGLYPVFGRPGLYTLDGEESELGFALKCIVEGGDFHTIGFLRYHYPEFLEGFQVAEWFLRSPDALSRLLMAASHGTLERAGRVVAEYLAKEVKA